jgi:hypothetical protein
MGRIFGSKRYVRSFRPKCWRFISKRSIFYALDMIILKINYVCVFVTYMDGIRSSHLSEIEYGTQNAFTLESVKLSNSYIGHSLNPTCWSQAASILETYSSYIYYKSYIKYVKFTKRYIFTKHWTFIFFTLDFHFWKALCANPSFSSNLRKIHI